MLSAAVRNVVRSTRIINQSRGLARKAGASRTGAVKAPKPAVPVDEAWEEVKDSASGQTYWWNTVTNGKLKLQSLGEVVIVS